METEDFKVSADDNGDRLDRYLAAQCEDLSRSRIKALIESGEVTINGTACESPSQKIREGDEIVVTVPPPEDADPEPEDIPLDILFEDESMLVINKPAGLVVHPGAGNHSGTLVNALLYHCGDSLSGIGGVIRPGIVHRLDKDTSGLMVVAKNDQAHRFLSDQLADRSLSRLYTALVWKIPAQLKGKVDAPIGRHKVSRQKMAINHRNGRDAVTHYTVKEKYGAALAQVECKLESGRMHQIRVHMESIGHPLIGDPFYGLQKNAQEALMRKEGYDEGVIERFTSFPRQALHAREIGFIHPVSKQEMRFKSDLPEDLSKIISLL